MSRAQRGALVGCALGFATGWNIGNIGGVSSALGRAYGVGLATVGLFTTALFVTHVGLQMTGGRVTDRHGPRRAGALALGFLATGNATALLAASPALLLGARAITGVGTALAFIAGSAMVRESGGSSVAQGVFGGIGLGAGGLAIAVVPHLLAPLGWRAPFWSSLGLAAAAAALLVALAPAGGERATTARPRARVVADRTLHRLAALYAASYGLSVILGNWVVELLQHHSSFSDEGAAAVGSLTLLLGVVTRPLGGWLLRARRRDARQLLSLSLAAGGVGTVALAASGPAWLAVVGGTLVGVGAGMPFSAAFTGAARARPDAPAAAVAFVNATANLVVLVGTPLVGLSFSLSGEGRAGFLVIAALWVAAIAVLPGPQAFILTSRTP